MSKQKKISLYLQGLCYVLGLMAIGYFAAAYWLIMIAPEGTDTRHRIFIMFPMLLLEQIFRILHEFRKVCIEIGRGNSFSQENQDSFRRMTREGIFAAVCFALRLPVLLWLGASGWLPYIATIILLLLAICFAILTEALSMLIGNAYEMRMENELTI